MNALGFAQTFRKQQSIAYDSSKFPNRDTRTVTTGPAGDHSKHRNHWSVPVGG